ncbi:MAG: type II secretion system protein GspC [Gammaproteobacteria bacterium]|nr:type II secretion system protein GspC [Gammaproteobacteria bacterium]
MFSELKNLTPQQLAARATGTLPPWVAVLLVIALVWQLSKITWMLFPRSEAIIAPQTPPAVTVELRGNDSAVIDTRSIVDAYLFGKPPEQPVVSVGPDITKIEDTDLKLTLHGTIAANEERLAMAIIATDRGDEKVYVVGDSVANGRTLHSVLPDRAILNHNGNLEALRLPRESEGTATTRTTRRTSQRQAPRQNRLQQALTQNPAKLTDLIRPQPVFSNGKQIGYRVYPGRRRQQFLALGLKPGDLVTDINGTPLNDPAKGADIFRSMSETNQVTVTVERNGSSQVLVLDPEQIKLDGDTKQ